MMLTSAIGHKAGSRPGKVLGEVVMTFDWEQAHIGVEGDPVSINGVKLWKHRWVRTQDAPIELPHPTHRSESHPFCIYEVTQGAKTVRFAATELAPSEKCSGLQPSA